MLYFGAQYLRRLHRGTYTPYIPNAVFRGSGEMLQTLQGQLYVRLKALNCRLCNLQHQHYLTWRNARLARVWYLTLQHLAGFLFCSVVFSVYFKQIKIYDFIS